MTRKWLFFSRLMAVIADGSYRASLAVSLASGLASVTSRDPQDFLPEGTPPPTVLDEQMILNTAMALWNQRINARGYGWRGKINTLSGPRTGKSRLHGIESPSKTPPSPRSNRHFGLRSLTVQPSTCDLLPRHPAVEISSPCARRRGVRRQC